MKLFLTMLGALMLFTAPASALDLDPGESQIVNCLLGDGACPVNPYATHGGGHPLAADTFGLSECQQCHDRDFLSRQVNAEGTRGCVAPSGNFLPFNQETGPTESRFCETRPGVMVEVIGTSFACLQERDQAACLQCHGKKFADEDLYEDNGHQNMRADNGALLLPCQACHDGDEEEDGGECREPSGDSPGDRHCQQDLTCSSCHASCDKLLSKCEDDD